MRIQKRVFNKIIENLNFDLFLRQQMAPNFCTLTKVDQTSFLIKFWVHPVEKKIRENLYVGLFWSHFWHAPESTHDMPVNQVSWSHIKTSVRKWRITFKIPNGYLFLCN